MRLGFLYKQINKLCIQKNSFYVCLIGLFLLTSLLSLSNLHNVHLVHRLVHNDPIESESRQIDRLEFAVHNHLGHRSSNGRRLLNAVPTEPSSNVQIIVVRMRSDDAVLVVRIVLVETSPAALHLDTLERGHSFGQRGPNVVVEPRRIDVQVVDGWFLVGRRTSASQKIAADAVAPEVDAVRIDGQRCVKAGIVGALRLKYVDVALSIKNKYY